ncbi:unnamed protein product [Ostreobium quekettii]|uniref:Uncharacterized protein n=1 Tax=Ostreobium quekettii TaxID=121088 RepID=A0A8S1IQL2_9CHLO|nr:unnamed protein product [Ostreobium quekettii]|eukprot:evm.model.scf_338.2 EVM.evm.TU.scf_338.2   scf_338:45861-49792(+)
MLWQGLKQWLNGLSAKAILQRMDKRRQQNVIDTHRLYLLTNYWWQRQKEHAEQHLKCNTNSSEKRGARMGRNMHSRVVIHGGIQCRAGEYNTRTAVSVAIGDGYADALAKEAEELGFEGQLEVVQDHISRQVFDMARMLDEDLAKKGQQRTWTFAAERGTHRRAMDAEKGSEEEAAPTPKRGSGLAMAMGWHARAGAVIVQMGQLWWMASKALRLALHKWRSTALQKQPDRLGGMEL